MMVCYCFFIKRIDFLSSNETEKKAISRAHQITSPDGKRTLWSRVESRQSVACSFNRNGTNYSSDIPHCCVTHCLHTSLCVQILFTVVFGSIFYWMTDQPADLVRFLFYLLICTLTSIVSQSFGLLTGAVCSIQVRPCFSHLTGNGQFVVGLQVNSLQIHWHARL